MFMLLTSVISKNSVIAVVKFTCRPKIWWLGKRPE